MTGLVILQVERRVDKREVGEQPLCADLAREFEQVVVGIVLVVVYPLFDLEYVDRENRRFTETESRLLRKQYVLYHHSAFGRDVRTVVDRAERSLRSRTRMHRVEVVDERFHSLEGRPVSLARRLFGRECLRSIKVGFGKFRKRFLFRLVVLFVAGKAGVYPFLVLYFRDSRLDVVESEHAVVDQFERLRQIGTVQSLVSLYDAGSETVIEVGDALSAVLVVLVGLDRYAGERRVTLYVVGLAKESVSRRETAFEQLEQIYLTAGCRQRVKIKVVNVYVAFSVRLALLGRENILFVIVFRALAAVFEHGAHRGVAVNIGVVALHIAVARVGERELVVYAHQSGVHFARLGTLRTVKNVFFRDIGIAVFHKDFFDHVLYVFDSGTLAGIAVFFEQSFLDEAREPRAFHVVFPARGSHRLRDRGLDLSDVVRYPSAVSLDYRFKHFSSRARRPPIF